MTTVKTIGVGGGFAVSANYSDLASWESYLNGLGTFTDTQVGRVLWISAGNELSATPVTFSGSAPTPTFPAILEAGDTNGNQGGSFRDHASKTTNPLTFNASAGACIRHAATNGEFITLTDVNITLRYLQIRKNGVNYNSIIQCNGSGCIIDSCILLSAPPGGGQASIATLSTVSNQLINSTLIMRANTTTTAFAVALTNGDMINNTIANVSTANSKTGISHNYAGSQARAWNNAFYNWSKDFGTNGSNFTSNNNATSQTSASSGLTSTSTNQYNLIGTTEFSSVTSGSEDLKLLTGSVACQEKGTTSGTGTPTVDILGQTRS